MKYPRKIEVTISGRQEFSSGVYVSNTDCYIARELKKLGYTDINVSGDAHVIIDNTVHYYPTESIDYRTIKQNMDRGEDTKVTLRYHREVRHI